MTDEQLPTRASRRADAKGRTDTASISATESAPTPEPAAETASAPATAAAAPRVTPSEPVTPPSFAPAPAPAAAQPAGAPSAPPSGAFALDAAAFDAPALDDPAPDDFPTDTIRPVHARKHRSHRVVRGLALGVVGLMAFAGTGVGVVYAQLHGNLTTAKVGDLVHADHTGTAAVVLPNDPNAGTALTYLVLGSDDRSGENAKLSDHASGGMRSDTTMVLHISENRKRVEVVSIPRDSMVNIPSCTMTNGKTTGASFNMFNAAFAYGWDNGGDIESAIACTWKTVEENASIHIDGAIVVDFAGFKDMVDALGGVPMCIPERTISDEAGHLDLQAGYQTLNGTEALGYARARKGVGQNFDGSDITRTGRQQQLVAAMFNQLLDTNVFTNLPALSQFAKAATKSLTVTESLDNTAKLVGLAYSLRSIRPKNVTFMTIPITAYPADHNRVIWSSAAATVWQNMADDKAIAEPDAPAKTTSASGTETDKGASTTTKTPAREAFTANDKTAECS